MLRSMMSLRQVRMKVFGRLKSFILAPYFVIYLSTVVNAWAVLILEYMPTASMLNSMAPCGNGDGRLVVRSLIN